MAGDFDFSMKSWLSSYSNCLCSSSAPVQTDILQAGRVAWPQFPHLSHDQSSSWVSASLVTLVVSNQHAYQEHSLTEFDSHRRLPSSSSH